MESLNTFTVFFARIECVGIDKANEKSLKAVQSEINLNPSPRVTIPFGPSRKWLETEDERKQKLE